MTTEIQRKMIHLQTAIYENEYYVHIYHNALAWNNMSITSIDQGEFTDREIINMCNDFWEMLPDSPEIRTDPFFKLCDICESMYDNED